MRKTKLLIQLLAVFLLTVPASAQRVEIQGWATQVEPQGKSLLQGNTEFEFDSKLGFGLGINFFLTERFSTQFTGTVVKPDALFRLRAPRFDFNLGDTKMIPLTGILQFHLIPRGPIDPYIGGGIGYVFFSEIKNTRDLRDLNIRSVDLDDDFSYVLNAGVAFRLSSTFAINVDAKYIPLEVDATAIFLSAMPPERAKLDVDPLLLSGGISLRF